MEVRVIEKRVGYRCKGREVRKEGKAGEEGEVEGESGVAGKKGPERTEW
jgi:hypothetical protein